MTRKVTSYRLPELTLNQIKELTESTGSSDANVITIAIDRMYREETQPMSRRSVNYSVEVNGDILYHDLDRHEASKIAQQEAARGQRVLVKWFRRQDGQHGYLNSDGNHEITGTHW